MKEKCRKFRAMKGYLQPICSCGSCWEEYFTLNSGKYNAARLALEQMGEDTVAEGQRIMLSRGMKGSDKDKVLTEQELVWIEAQTGRFVKALLYRVRADKKQEQTEKEVAA